MLLSNSKYKTQKKLLGTCDVNKIASIKNSLVLELKSSRWMCHITRTQKLRMGEPIYVSSKAATLGSQDGHRDFYELMKRYGHRL